MSEIAAEAVQQLRVIAADASSAVSLAERLLAALQPAIPFDDAEVLAVDGDSLLFTRLLAYRGDRLPHFAFFLRDVYLVSREPDWLSLPRLLGAGGGSAVFHERFDRWMRATPPAMSQQAFTQFWRDQQSPPGGGLRYGLAYRRRWVAVLQIARWTPSNGFTASQLELLDRVAPFIGAAIAVRLVGATAPETDKRIPVPAPGHLIFNGQRRLTTIDDSGQAWLDRLIDDGLRPFGVDVPVAIQSAVNCLWASDRPVAVSHLADRHGVNVTVRAERAQWVSPSPGEASGPLISVSLGRTAWSAEHPAIRLMTSRQRQIAFAVADGSGDEAIASDLTLSPATIHEHVQALHRVMGTHSRSALVAALNRN